MYVEVRSGHQNPGRFTFPITKEKNISKVELINFECDKRVRIYSNPDPIALLLVTSHNQSNLTPGGDNIAAIVILSQFDVLMTQNDSDMLGQMLIPSVSDWLTDIKKKKSIFDSKVWFKYIQEWFVNNDTFYKSLHGAKTVQSTAANLLKQFVTLKYGWLSLMTDVVGPEFMKYKKDDDLNSKDFIEWCFLKSLDNYKTIQISAISTFPVTSQMRLYNHSSTNFLKIIPLDTESNNDILQHFVNIPVLPPRCNVVGNNSFYLPRDLLQDICIHTDLVSRSSLTATEPASLLGKVAFANKQGFKRAGDREKLSLRKFTGQRHFEFVLKDIYGDNLKFADNAKETTIYLSFT